MIRAGLVALCAFGMAFTSACGGSPSVSESESESGEHTHAYKEEITLAATCTEEGLKTFTCDCGDSYTETVPAQGHKMENGVCTVCGKAEGRYITYELSEDGTYYSVVSVCEFNENDELLFDRELIIPSEHEGLPVKALERLYISSFDARDSVYIPASVIEIAPQGFVTKTIFVESANESYMSSQGVLFTKDGKTLVAYPSAKEDSEYIVPDGVEKIEWRAFYFSFNLFSLTISDSVTEVADSAFDWTSIKKLTIGRGMKTMSRGVFGTSSDYNPGAILEVYNLGGTDLEEAGLSPKVVHTSSEEESVLQKDGDFYFACFDGTYYIVGGVRGADTWRLPESFAYRGETMNRYEVYESAFSGGFEETFSRLVISDAVTKIGEAGFYGCAAESLIIGDSVTEIGGFAFQWCKSLKEVVLGGGLTRIGELAFSFMDLEKVYYKGTAEEWEKITIEEGNEALAEAELYLYSENEPAAEGKYWHYSEGEVVVW